MKVLLVGAGGHALVCLDLLEQLGHEVIGCLSRDGNRAPGIGVPLLGGDDVLESRIAGQSVAVCPAIGENRARLAIVDRVQRCGGTLATVISPHAVVSRRAVVGEGSVLMPGATVNAGTTIGRGAIVNTNAAVDHDCVLADGVHVAPGAVLAGAVEVGKGVLIGVGARVLPGLSIGAAATIGAGAVVIADVEPGVTVAGVPARTINGEAGPR